MIRGTGTNESARLATPYRRVLTPTGSLEHLVPYDDLVEAGDGLFVPSPGFSEARSLCGQHQQTWRPAEGALLCGRCADYA